MAEPSQPSGSHNGPPVPQVDHINSSGGASIEKRRTSEVGADLVHTTSSSDQPPSIFMKATSFLASRASVGSAPGFFGGISSRTASNPPVNQSPGSWGPKSVVWRWITGGSGATLLAARRARGANEIEDEHVPVTISLPDREAVEGVTDVSVRTTENPRVDVLLVASSKTSGSGDRDDIFPSGRQDEVIPLSTRKRDGRVMSDAGSSNRHPWAGLTDNGEHSRYATFKTFCAIHANVCCDIWNDEKSNLPLPSSGRQLVSAFTSASFDSDDTSVEDLVSLLRDCARFGTTTSSLTEISDLISDAQEYDSSHKGCPTNETDNPCQLARMLILLHNMLLGEAEGSDITSLVSTAVEAVLDRWDAAKGESNTAAPNWTPTLPSLYAKYIKTKSSFLAANQEIFEGNFSTARLLRRIDIESVDDGRHFTNKALRLRLSSADTLDQMLGLLADLRSILDVSSHRIAPLHDVNSISEAMTPQKAIDAERSCVGSSEGLHARKASVEKIVDAASKELIYYLLALEAFYICGSIENMIQSGDCNAGLAATETQVRKTLHAFQVFKNAERLSFSALPGSKDSSTSRRKFLLEEALLPIQDGVYRFDAKRFSSQSKQSLLRVAENLSARPKGKVSSAQPGRDQIGHRKEEPSQEGACAPQNFETRIPALEQSSRSRQVDCTFLSIESLHSAFGREIRERRESSSLSR